MHSTRPRTIVFMTYLRREDNQVDSAMSRRKNPQGAILRGRGPVGGVRPKGEDLRPVGAFKGFVHGPHGDRPGDTDGVPDEFVLGGFTRWSTITLGARAARTLWIGGVGIQ